MDHVLHNLERASGEGILEYTGMYHSPTGKAEVETTGGIVFSFKWIIDTEREHTKFCMMSAGQLGVSGNQSLQPSYLGYQLRRITFAIGDLAESCLRCVLPQERQGKVF